LKIELAALTLNYFLKSRKNYYYGENEENKYLTEIILIKKEEGVLICTSK
jgi:hypothetical protein